jgi:hypothetical protein
MKWKVTYISRDLRTIGNDKFDTVREARWFALGLKKAGYTKISIFPCDDL